MFNALRAIYLRNNCIKKYQLTMARATCGCGTPFPAPRQASMAPTLTRKIVSTPMGPKPVGPYNQAVVLENTVYVSGCLGLDVCTMELVAGGAAAEARQALKSLQNILGAAGSNIKNVVKTTVFLDDIGNFAEVNEVYKEFFTEDCPARSCFQVAKLPLNAKVEVEAIAGVGNMETVHLSS